MMTVTPTGCAQLRVLLDQEIEYPSRQEMVAYYLNPVYSDGGLTQDDFTFAASQHFPSLPGLFATFDEFSSCYVALQKEFGGKQSPGPVETALPSKFFYPPQRPASFARDTDVQDLPEDFINSASDGDLTNTLSAFLDAILQHVRKDRILRDLEDLPFRSNWGAALMAVVVTNSLPFTVSPLPDDVVIGHQTEVLAADGTGMPQRVILTDEETGRRWLLAKKN